MHEPRSPIHHPTEYRSEGLVAEAHGGMATARNLDDDDGVEFTISLAAI